MDRWWLVGRRCWLPHTARTGRGTEVVTILMEFPHLLKSISCWINKSHHILYFLLWSYGFIRNGRQSTHYTVIDSSVAKMFLWWCVLMNRTRVSIIWALFDVCTLREARPHLWLTWRSLSNVPRLPPWWRWPETWYRADGVEGRWGAASQMASYSLHRGALVKSSALYRE